MVSCLSWNSSSRPITRNLKVVIVYYDETVGMRNPVNVNVKWIAGLCISNICTSGQKQTTTKTKTCCSLIHTRHKMQLHNIKYQQSKHAISYLYLHGKSTNLFIQNMGLLTTFTKVNTQSYQNINSKHMTKELHCYNLYVLTIFKLGFNKNTTTFTVISPLPVSHSSILIFKHFNLFHRTGVVKMSN